MRVAEMFEGMLFLGGFVNRPPYETAPTQVVGDAGSATRTATSQPAGSLASSSTATRTRPQGRLAECA